MRVNWITIIFSGGEFELMGLFYKLQDYLETKRVAFPRFYFVAPADLLDILSKGSNPQAILRCDNTKVRDVNKNNRITFVLFVW